MFSDLRFAVRTLAKAPGFATVAIITLAIAIGVNAAIFSIVNGVMLRPVVSEKPKEVVNIFTARKEANRDYRQFSYAEFSTLREANPMFRDVGALSFTLTSVGRAEAMRRSFVFFVSDNLFNLLGTTPAAGRFFTAEETRPNADQPVVVASHALWQRMGGRPDFVGSTLQVNGQAFTVIGITRRGFTGVNAMLTPEVWLPLGIYSRFSNPFADSHQLADLTNPTNYALNLMGRLQPGLSLKAAAGMLGVLEKRLNAIQPPNATVSTERVLQLQPPSRLSISTSPANDGPLQALSGLLLGMAAIVLLIACLNLANMLLARGATRAREFAIRVSVGASRWRVVRQLLVEGLVLSLAGGVVGFLIAQWTDDVLSQSLNRLFQAMSFSITMELRPDANVMGATFLFCVVATLLFGLGPALKSVRADVVHDLKQQGGEPAALGRWNRFFSGRHCLVLAQLALSLVLLFSGGLFFRGALNAAGLDLGFSTAGGVVAEIDYSMTNTGDALARQRMFAVLARARQLPGVRQASLSTGLPYTNISSDRRVMPADAAPAADPKAPPPGFDGLFAGVTPGFFEAIGLPLLRGRTFTTVEAENKEGPLAAIIDERLAKQLFPKAEALGQRLRYTTPPTDGSPAEMEVVGIVGNCRHDPGTGEPPGHLYLPLAKAFGPAAFVNLRLATTDPRAVRAAVAVVRGELRKLDPDLPLLRVTTFADLVAGNAGLWVIRLGAVLFGAFGSIALLLAVVGVYGVKAYAVARRRRELGIRMALGAMPADVFRLIMKQAVLQVVFAIASGTLLALLVGRALSSMLFNVSPGDPLVLGLAITLLAGTALVACYVPARRATRVNPTEALRSE